MNKKIEIKTMTARHVYSTESLSFVKKVIKELFGEEIPEKAREIHKQNKPFDYTDEYRIYGSPEKGIMYHSHYKVQEGKDPKASIYTISNESYGYPDIWISFSISSQDGLILELESTQKKRIDFVIDLFERDYGYCREQSKEEIFDELIHELRIRGTENNGLVGIERGLKAIEIYPNDFWAQFYLGCSYALNNQHQKAIIHLQKAIEIDKKNHDAYYNLAKSYLALNQLREAKIAIEQAKKLAYNNHVITYYLARILDNLGEKAEAIKYYQEAIATAPENISAEKRLKISYLEDAEKRLDELKK